MIVTGRVCHRVGVPDVLIHESRPYPAGRLALRAAGRPPLGPPPGAAAAIHVGGAVAELVHRTGDFDAAQYPLFTARTGSGMVLEEIITAKPTAKYDDRWAGPRGSRALVDAAWRSVNGER